MAELWSADDLFRWFILQQQQVAMIHLGKMVHPGTGEIERDLDAARLSIDLLGMLETKTKGNLSGDEERLLGQVLATLRLNFVQESSRSPEPAQEDGAGKPEGTSGQAPPGETAGEADGASPNS